MKKSVTLLIIVLLSAHCQTNARKNPEKSTSVTAKDSIRIANEDSIAKATVSPGQVWIVGTGNYSVFLSDEVLSNNKAGCCIKDTLPEGEKFTITGIIRGTSQTGIQIKLANGKSAIVLPVSQLKRFCYKEGESSLPVTIHHVLDMGLNFRKSTFWYTLLITGVTSILFLIIHPWINRKLFQWCCKEPETNKAANIFLIATAIFGSLTGVFYLFNGTGFKDFAMNMPIFSYPGDSGFIEKFYWSLQLFFLLFYAWMTYRNIIKMNLKSGIILSLIMLVPAFAIFWTSMALSFIILLAVIAVLILSAMGSTALNDLSKGPQPSVAIKEVYDNFGTEKKTVKISYDQHGREKSRKYI